MTIITLKNTCGADTTVHISRRYDGSFRFDVHSDCGSRLDDGVMVYSDLTNEAAIQLANALIDAVEAP